MPESRVRADERCALFPLDALLLPDATLPLQIFEPRYLMMVSRCMREDDGFVVLLGEPEPGHKVIGCWGKIIDFGQLDNGLLGITVAGLCRVQVSDVDKDATGLWWGSVQPLEEIAADEHAVADWQQHYQPLLEALLDHPYLANQVGIDLQRPLSALHQLMGWLPLERRMKQRLLDENDLVERCVQLDRMLSDMAGVDV
ncbi:hypothetical protein BGP77_09360 [Saccharospirillum sp. MSK14-1]|uniref:LON peptidase substrate-binding domain-containing protein n=1 Tax=Saccharospirillum sp. MSK14-1 TaxID=1897632 RepID=UPI000D382BE6|nr:LON peptidase substrate-binding domain-containing protein [Saccharospirillum sp. MSK14-1]PTY38954.1 hypothetical protein BGP77_09360 [Saccharospirillum sp. MSK14-1]